MDNNILYYNVQTTYYGGEIVLYNGEKYLIELPKNKICITNENPEASGYYKKMI